MSTNNPYQAPTTLSKKNYKRSSNPRRYEYGGIGRLTYFLASLGIGIVNNSIQYLAVENNMPAVVFACAIVGFVATISLVAFRLANIGSSGWWVLLVFVPLLNIWILVRCLAVPEGYADHKTLDTAAKVIIGTILSLFVLIVLIIVSTV